MITAKLPADVTSDGIKSNVTSFKHQNGQYNFLPSSFQANRR